ncbi:MAG: homocysteine S-methyltransferase family protein [Rhodobacteraceae bacterium]|nr:homocysteine S-methyltransferase family protein [Paracoccaceae bacterium]
MGRYDRLMDRIAKGDRILIDGATGTEIERRGVPQLDNAWNGGGALSHPEVLCGVHEDYIREGAEIVISNTFATHRHALCDAGMEHRFEFLNRRGVELAIEARERARAPEVLVAGGISYWSWSGNWLEPKDLATGAEEQAFIMAQAGADLLMLEMMVDVDSLLVTLEAARASGLPVWVGLSCAPDESGNMVLLRGGALADALDVLNDRMVPVVCIMHTEVEDIDPCLDIVDDHWPGPVGVYAHSAQWEGQVCIFDDTITPAKYAVRARSWLERGVRIIGGCCGLGVEHIQALKRIL